MVDNPRHPARTVNRRIGTEKPVQGRHIKPWQKPIYQANTPWQQSPNILAYITLPSAVQLKNMKMAKWDTLMQDLTPCKTQAQPGVGHCRRAGPAGWPEPGLLAQQPAPRHKKPGRHRAHLGLHVFATVPHSKDQEGLTIDMNVQKTGMHLLANVNPEDPGVESLRSLRTALQFAMLDAPNNVVLITGATPSIGKSFTSANFAAVLGTVFLVARAEVSTLGELQESAKRLKHAGVTVRGVIFNDVNITKRR